MPKNMQVTGEVTETLLVRVELQMAPVIVPDDAEVMLVVNGRTVRRMTVFQAVRLGLAERKDW